LILVRKNGALLAGRLSVHRPFSFRNISYGLGLAEIGNKVVDFI